MKVLLAGLVFVVALYEVNAACYQAWLLPPDDEPCEPKSEWDDMEECVKCTCDSSGYMKSCCSISGYPVVRDSRKCESFRNENCEWKVRGKKPKWDKFCNRYTTLLG
ncbi:hypothetical protein HOLleu_02608 [Holothuria leucospilota]|uniref:Uncharacterized protein n=1 Tax=Holothuria leucospilota TaxID=206669 RepID=A0A9Q1CRI5_HOLLE|nr:hypothetical protein HOLleu_02608 [Holothuria leucospilota]